MKMSKKLTVNIQYLIIFLVYFSSVSCVHQSMKKSTPEDYSTKSKQEYHIDNNSTSNVDSWEISDGIFMSFPAVNDWDGESVVNFSLSQPRGKGSGGGGGGGHNKKLLQRILPMFLIPFLIQSAILPMFLSTLKMMLVKSLIVGKVALLLIAINALKSSNAFKSRSEEKIADVHYGYHGSGMEEYGAYVNRRSIDPLSRL